MANIVKVTPIITGPRQYVFHVYLKSDGVSGDLDKEVIFDPEDYGLDKRARMTLLKESHELVGFLARLEGDTGLVDPFVIWVLSDQAMTNDFENCGGLSDRSTALDGLGNIMLSTAGFTSSDAQGSILLTLRVKPI